MKNTDLGNHINTVLFDLDGTLINTIDLIVASFLHTMDIYYPDQYKKEDVISFIGPPLSETFTKLDAAKVEEMTKTYREYNLENHDALISEYQGVNATVEILHQQGYKLAVVTTKRRETALKGLKLMGLEQYFPVIVSIDEVTKYKPDPEPLNLALQELDSSADSALMVGDSEHDILGGKNAGTRTAGVSWSIKGKNHLAGYEPDVMLDKMSDLLEYLGVAPKV